MEFKKIKTVEDIISYARDNNCNIFDKDRMKEKNTELFKVFIKKPDIIWFKMRELEKVGYGKKCIFKLCLIKEDGKVEIEQNYATKKELQEDFNKLKL